MTDQPTSADADILRLLAAIDTHTRCSVAISRACLVGLATISADARKAIDEALIAGAFEAASERDASESASEMITRTRLWLNAEGPRRDALRLDLERALVKQAEQIEPPLANQEGAEIRRQA